MFKKLFFREKKCVNTHTIFYEELDTFPPYLLFKAKIRGDFYGFNIIAFRRMYELALKNRKAMTNPHDPFNRKISNKIIKRAKKFWKKKSRKYYRIIIAKMLEYNYSTIQLNWPKPLSSYPKNLRLDGLLIRLLMILIHRLHLLIYITMDDLYIRDIIIYLDIWKLVIQLKSVIMILNINIMKIKLILHQQHLLVSGILINYGLTKNLSQIQ